VKRITVHIANGGRITREVPADDADDFLQGLCNLNPALRFLGLPGDNASVVLINVAHVMRIDIEPVAR
jgi:hypothetical protein